MTRRGLTGYYNSPAFASVLPNWLDVAETVKMTGRLKINILFSLRVHCGLYSSMLKDTQTGGLHNLRVKMIIYASRSLKSKPTSSIDFACSLYILNTMMHGHMISEEENNISDLKD